MRMNGHQPGNNTDEGTKQRKNGTKGRNEPLKISLMEGGKKETKKSKLFAYTYIYIYICISEGGGDSERGIVSFCFVRACVRARGLVS